MILRLGWLHFGGRPDDEHDQLESAADGSQYHANHPANLASVGDPPAGWIHHPSVDLLQVIISNDPSGYAERKTTCDTQYSKCENHGSSMGCIMFDVRPG